jgi:hypothetical protein
MFDGKIKTSEYGSLVVTHECNKNCPFCIDKYRGRNEFITMENVENALCEAEELGLKEILIVGGEPTLHPQIVEIAEEIQFYGFKSILTTNYTNPKVIKDLDGIVDCFNISFYNQKNIPFHFQMESDLTISALIHNRHLNHKVLLDAFIDKWEDYGHLKFSTLSVCNDWTRENQYVDYLDNLPSENIELFGEIQGQIYRRAMIKRYDKVINKNAPQSVKFHVDGTISRTWERNI